MPSCAAFTANQCVQTQGPTDCGVHTFVHCYLGESSFQILIITAQLFLSVHMEGFWSSSQVIFIRAWNLSWKWGFSWKWKSKIAEKVFPVEKQIDKHGQKKFVKPMYIDFAFEA